MAQFLDNIAGLNLFHRSFIEASATTVTLATTADALAGFELVCAAGAATRIDRRSSMDVDRGTVAAALAIRVELYNVLWRAFAGCPDGNLLNIAAGSAFRRACRAVGRVEVPPVPTSVRGRVWEEGADGPLLLDASVLASQVVDAIAAAGDRAVETFSSEYNLLVFAPAKHIAPPWESVYVSGEDQLFQPSMLDVRAAYRLAGYEIAAYPREADDHIAYELGFMATLASRTAERFEAGSTEVAGLLDAQLRFLGDHLAIWLRPYARRLEAHAPKGVSALYPALAYLACAACVQDRALLEELVAQRV